MNIECFMLSGYDSDNILAAVGITWSYWAGEVVCYLGWWQRKWGEGGERTGGRVGGNHRLQ